MTYKDEIGRIIKNDRKKSRGYATFFESPNDKPIGEVLVTYCLFRHLSKTEQLPLIVPIASQSDPPDVWAEMPDGSKVGVEVTELVDSAAIERSRARRKDKTQPPLIGEWTPESVRDKLLQIINAKVCKCKNAKIGFEQLWLIIYTDEELIDYHVAKWVVEKIPTLSVENFDRIFFLLSYHPSADKDLFPDGCPILEIEFPKTEPL